jgi:membrane-associated phospholipid phosphatase
VLLVWEEVFHARWVNILVALVCLWVWRVHGLRNRALWAFGTVMVSWALALVTKEVVRRARPVVDDAIALAPGFSFPSGHVASAATAAGAVVVLLWPVLGRRGRVIAGATGALAVVLTAADRVLLGVHYPTDAVAGIAFGAAVVGGSYLGFVGSAPRSARDRGR